MSTKTRFAPSPTGFLHIGGLRSALFNYLFTKKHGGQFLLRLEDTDRARFVEGATENIIKTLKWAGMIVDEGPHFQSERLDIYHEYVQKLRDQGDAYYCTCSKERLDELRKAQQGNKQPTGYDGHCRDLGLGAEDSSVVRLKMSKVGTTVFEDIIRGKVEFENKLIDDQVLVKSDGFPTYHFAVVVDDHLMEITHVIRGEEWVSSVPKHIAIYKALGFPLPTFAHLPLLVNEKKQKLSKRHGDVSVEDFKEKGYLVEALINFIAFLGWNPGTEQEIFSLEELVDTFELEKVQKAPAIFNREKLDWFNKHYIINMPSAELAEVCQPFYVNAGVLHETRDTHHETSDIDLSGVVALEQGRANTLVDIVENTGYIFADELVYEPELLVWKKSTKEETLEILKKLSEFLIGIDENDWSREVLEEKVMPWIKEQGFGNGDVLWPMRVALSGLKNSPGPLEIAGVLGREKSLDRIHGGTKLL